MAGGVEMPDGMLTGGGAGRGAAAAGTGADGGAGGGIGVFTTGAGAGVEDLEEDLESGLEGAFTITGGGETRGLAAFDSCLAAMGRGTGEVLVDSGIGGGELAIGGENMIDCCLDLAGPGSADGSGGDPTGFSFSESFVFGTARGSDGCTTSAAGVDRAGRAGFASTGGT
jgi:hypothetical protein